MLWWLSVRQSSAVLISWPCKKGNKYFETNGIVDLVGVAAGNGYTISFCVSKYGKIRDAGGQGSRLIIYL